MLVHFRVPRRRLVGQRIGTLTVVAQIGRGCPAAFVFIASDDDVGRSAAAAG